MKIRCAALIVVAGIVIASCSKKLAPDREKHSSTPEATRAPKSEVAKGADERQPPEDEIAEDCVAFLRATKVISPKTPSADCPGCPPEGAEVLAFRQMKIERISCSGDACSVVVTIRAVFNPGSGERIAGGLAGWISPEQRNEYLSGRTPSGEQTYRVAIAYQHRDEEWRAVDFDRAPAE